MDFPRLPITPGRYAAEWFIDGKAIAGEIDLESAKPPRLTFFGEAMPLVWETNGGTRRAGFPQDHTIPQIVGRLRDGQDVVVNDTHVSVWAPERSSGFGRYAVVGLGIADAIDGRFSRIRLQITAADMLFGIAPIRAVTFPDPATFAFKGNLGAELNPESIQHWYDDSSNLGITCRYDGNFSLTNTYRHQLLFAPIVQFDGEPATVDEWMSRWIRPLLGLTALSTRGPQRLSWLTVHTHSDEQGAEAVGSSGVLFGSSIYQEPFQAEYREEWRDPRRKPLFTLRDLPIGLPAVLGHWRTLEASQNPFLELYRSVLFQPELPPRARFLYLVQALEGLHAYEHRSEDERSQIAFELKRQSALTKLAAAGVFPKTLGFIKRNWSRRRIDSLDRRLRSLISAMPKGLRDHLAQQELPLASDLDSGGEGSLEAKIRRLRNDLSHGSRLVGAKDLVAWVDLSELITQFHLLLLLGFGSERIGELLAARSAENGLTTNQ